MNERSARQRDVVVSYVLADGVQNCAECGPEHSLVVGG